jgi:hypothetical protein
MDKANTGLFFIDDSLPTLNQQIVSQKFKAGLSVESELGVGSEDRQMEKSKFYEIARIFSFILRAAQLTAVIPLEIISKKGTGILKFEYKLLSVWFVYSVISFILMIFFLLSYYLNRELNIDLGIKL